MDRGGSRSAAPGGRLNSSRFSGVARHETCVLPTSVRPGIDKPLDEFYSQSSVLLSVHAEARCARGLQNSRHSYD
jgi:hypothetical protein